MRLEPGPIVTLDWETYYDGEYSLRSKDLNTSEYIRDERFIAHCVGIKRGNGPVKVYWYDDIRPAIEAIPWSHSYLLCHNTAFDGLILAEHYHIAPKLYLDTMSMGKGLHGTETRVSLDALAALYGLGNKVKNVLGQMKGHRVIPMELRDAATAYTKMDVKLCRVLFDRMIGIYPAAEIQLIDWTIRQFADPVLMVDVPRAQAEMEREIERKHTLITSTGLSEEDLQSSAKLAKHLEGMGVSPPMKTSPRTKLQTFAFSQQDEEFMALVTHERKEVRDLIAARLAAKSTIGETRALRLVKIGDRTLPIGYNYYGAHTGRWSGANKMNPQNLPKEERDDLGTPIPLTGELRKCIVAPEGNVLVVADSAQIEARITAWLAGQEDLLQLFRDGGDPYCALASEIYDRPISKADRDERAIGKAGVLGLGFYMGAARFQATLALGILGPKMEMSTNECYRIVNAYRKKNDKIKALWDELGQVIVDMWKKPRVINCTPHTILRKHPEGENHLCIEYDSQRVWLPNGMSLHYPNIEVEEGSDPTDDRGDYSYRGLKEYTRIHAGILTENLVQALARVVIGEQLLRINEQYRVAMMSHDELVAVAPVHEADHCLNFMITEMSKPPEWAPTLPLKAEGGYDRCYSK